MVRKAKDKFCESILRYCRFEFVKIMIIGGGGGSFGPNWGGVLYNFAIFQFLTNIV